MFLLSSSTSTSSSSSWRRDQLWLAVSLLIPSQPCWTGRDTSINQTTRITISTINYSTTPKEQRSTPQTTTGISNKDQAHASYTFPHQTKDCPNLFMDSPKPHYHHYIKDKHTFKASWKLLITKHNEIHRPMNSTAPAIHLFPNQTKPKTLQFIPMTNQRHTNDYFFWQGPLHYKVYWTSTPWWVRMHTGWTEQTDSNLLRVFDEKLMAGQATFTSLEETRLTSFGNYLPFQV